MFDLEHNVVNGLALAIAILIIFMIFFTLVPIILLACIGVPKKIANGFVGFCALIGFFIWGYLIFYSDFSSLFL